MLKSPWIRKPDFSNISHLNYDAYWAHRGWKVNASLKPREEIMLRMVPKGARVVDIGCGNSLLPVKLKEKGVSIEVADISPKVLEGYKAHGIRGTLLNIESIESIRFDAKYDYIILSEVLEHTRNPEEVLSELKKYTKHFLITVPNSAAYVFRYGLLVRGRFFTQWVYHPSEHLRFWSHIDFLDWLQAMGLTVQETEVSDGFTLRGLLPFLPKLWKNFLGYRMVYKCETK